MKFSKNPKNKIDIIYPNELLFAYVAGENLSQDLIFERAKKILGKQDDYTYQISYLKNDKAYMVFFTKFENLKEAKNAVALPLIFTSFSISNEPFALIFCDEKMSFVSFFKNEKMLYFKFLPKASLSDFKKSENLEKHFDLIASQIRLNELLSEYESKVIFSLNDEFDFSEFVANLAKIKNEKLDSKIKDYQSLAQNALNKLGENANFIKKTHKDKSVQIASFVFLLSFLAAFVLAFLLNYSKYKENKNIINSNNELSKLEQKIDDEMILLDEKIKLLRNDINELSSSNLENEELFKNVNLSFDKDKISNLAKIIRVLNENDLQILALNYEKTMILQFNNKASFQKAVEVLKPNFILLEKACENCVEIEF